MIKSKKTDKYGGFKVETIKKTLNMNKGGSGGVNFRVSLPVDWIRKMNINENNRKLELSFDGERIIIKKDSGE